MNRLRLLVEEPLAHAVGGRRRHDRADRVVPLLLFVITLSYMAFWPHDILPSDEGFFLYEAKRLLAGAVFYRDFFDNVTPLAWYLMAVLFRVFGTTMETARISMAFLHGAIVALVYLASRAVGVRRSLSIAAALAHPAICYRVLPSASPHWLSAFLMLVMLLLVLYRPAAAGWWWPLLLGFLAGVLIGTQQQKGLAMAVGAGAVIVADDRFGIGRGRLTVVLAWFVAGVSIVVAPLLLALCITAGFDDVFYSLVVFPLRQYRPFHTAVAGWGFHVPVFTSLFPWLLPYAPILFEYGVPAVLTVALVRLARAALAGAGARSTRDLAMLTAWGGFTVLSTWYVPNYTHLGLVGPVFMVLMAENLEWTFHTVLGRGRLLRAAGYVLTCLLLVALGIQLELNMHLERRLYPFPHTTAFGRIDFANRDEPRLVATLRKLVKREVPSREIFAYPSYAALYLMTGTVNPTRYQLLLMGYNSPAQVEETIDMLERRKVAYVAVLPFAFISWDTDPVVRYLALHYDHVDFGARNRPSPYMLLRRRASDVPPVP